MQGRVDCSVRPHHRQIYLAKEEYEKLKKWAEDDLPFQPIESTINLATGKEGYSDFNSFHTEKSANLSLSPTQLLTARGVTRLLRGKVVKARSDREEAMSRAGADGETVVAYAIATSPRPPNKDEGEEWWSKLAQKFLNYPSVKFSKTYIFDEAAAKLKSPLPPKVIVRYLCPEGNRIHRLNSG